MVELIKKAWKVNLDRVDNGWEYGEHIIYADTKGQAKTMFYLDEYTVNGQYCNFLTIPIIRAKYADKVLYKGETYIRSILEKKLATQSRHAELDKLIKGDAKLYYILKHGVYYRPDCSGYTNFKSQAGVYEVKDAVTQAKSCEDLILIPVDIEEHNALINKKIEILKKGLIK